MSARRRGGSTCPPALRKALMLGFIVLAALPVLGFLGYAQLLSFLQGEGFRASLEKELANKAQASRVELAGNLSIDANRLSLKGLSLQRADLLQELSCRSIHAELKRAALLDKQLHLTRLMVEEGSLSLHADRKGAELPAIRKSAAGFLSRLAPKSARLDHVDIKDFNTTLTLGGRTFRLADSALSASPTTHRGKGWEVRLSNGRVHTPLPILGDSSLKSATLTLGGKTATLSDARFMLSPGELIVNAAREQASGNWSADVRANSVDIARLIGEDWKKRLSGMLYGRIHAEGNSEGLRQAEGRLSLQQGVLEALPFLSDIPVGESYPYRSLKLDKASARLSYPHADAARNIRNAWLLDDIELRAQGGWLCVRGHALVDADGSLGGALLIGLPENVATPFAPPGSPLRNSIFNAEGEKGYLWLRLNLSGSLSNPQEDLSVRLRTLLNSALPDAANTLRNLLIPRKAASPAEGDRSPAAAPARMLEEAGDTAGDIISTGLRSIF